MYINDENQVPLRTGQGIQYRIVHSGVSAGTQVEVLQQDPESGHTLVREPGGKQGWLPTRFLTAEPIARDRLRAAENELQRLREQTGKTREERETLVQENQRLQAENANLTNTARQLQEELQHIRRVSENAINLDRRNQELQETNQQLKNEVDVLTAENLQLKDSSDTDRMLIGAGLVCLGILIAIVVPWMKPKKKSSWA